MLADATGFALLGIGKDTWEDHSVETTVILLERRPIGPGCPSSFEAGLLMYFKGDKCYFCAVYTGLWDGRGPGILLGVSDGWAPPIASDYKPLKVEFGSEYRIKMAEENGLIKGYLDEERILEISMDKTITSGTPDLYIINIRAHFDDFIVTGGNVPDGGPGGVSFLVKPQGRLTTTWGNIKSEL